MFYKPNIKDMVEKYKFLLHWAEPLNDDNIDKIVYGCMMSITTEFELPA